MEGRDDRLSLREIRDWAQERSEIDGLNHGWRRAYERLADAADALEAFFARCEDVEPANTGH